MVDLLVTIDGPAASGKSTVAQLLAERLCADFLDTGAMYRAVALAAIQNGIDVTDEDKLLDLLEHTEFDFTSEKGGMAARIGDRDVTEQIRRPEVTAKARYVAAAPTLRSRLIEMQRRYALARRRIVSEGRDQGTVAFPDADVKFFLTADAAERAERRRRELGERGIVRSLKQIRRSIDQRDKSDKDRNVGPLKPAGDAITIDTTDLSIEEVVQELLRWVEKKCSKTP